MRRFLLSLIVVASLPTLTACNDGDKPLFMLLNYQVSCRNVGGCSGIPPRQIETLDAEAGNFISCGVTDAGDQWLLDMSFDHPSSDPLEDYGLALSNVSVSKGGGPAANGTIAVTEESNLYRGRVGGSPPAATCSDDPPTMCPIPCRLFDIEFGDSANGPTIRGKIQCEGLPLNVDSMVSREIHFPTDRTMPADFLIENCDGLE
jgi:hypothetical protein